MGGIKMGDGNAYKLDDTPTNHCFGGCWPRHSLPPTPSGGTGRWCISRYPWIAHRLADHSSNLARHRQSTTLAQPTVQRTHAPSGSSGRICTKTDNLGLGTPIRAEAMPVVGTGWHELLSSLRRRLPPMYLAGSHANRPLRSGKMQTPKR